LQNDNLLTVFDLSIQLFAKCKPAGATLLF